VGPDNGLLVPAAKKAGIESVIKLTNHDFWLGRVSSTFHGRDIFAPVGARLSTGVPIEKFGEKVEATEYVELDLFETKQNKDQLIGTILNIDSFGNIITNFSKDVIEKRFGFHDEIMFEYSSSDNAISTELDVTFERSGNKQILKVPFKNTYGDVQKGSLIALISSSGFLEIAGNQVNADSLLKLSIGDSIAIKL
jgi:S-adenosylmethionine hydrolase